MRARSHRVSAIFVVIIIPFFGVAFVFLFLFLVFFLVWFFSKADIGNGGAIRRV
jgi:Na+-transporting methylmalonyl-CoA/oxaloacetate decarboxylase gamma subunit